MARLIRLTLTDGRRAYVNPEHVASVVPVAAPDPREPQPHTTDGGQLLPPLSYVQVVGDHDCFAVLENCERVLEKLGMTLEDVLNA